MRIIVNLVVTGYFTYFFYTRGFDKYPLYMLALLFKIVGYFISALIERVFFPERQYYYHNMALGYKKVFGTFFLIDILLMITLLIIAHLCKNYI